MSSEKLNFLNKIKFYQVLIIYGISFIYQSLLLTIRFILIEAKDFFKIFDLVNQIYLGYDIGKWVVQSLVSILLILFVVIEFKQRHYECIRQFFIVLILSFVLQFSYFLFDLVIRENIDPCSIRHLEDLLDYVLPIFLLLLDCLVTVFFFILGKKYKVEAIISLQKGFKLVLITQIFHLIFGIGTIFIELLEIPSLYYLLSAFFFLSICIIGIGWILAGTHLRK